MEEFVDGIEVEVGVLGNLAPVASVPGEIVVSHNEWYDYEAKYEEGEMELVIPARISPEQSARAQELAVRGIRRGRLRGDGARRHVRSSEGEVLVNELNTIPGFTQTSVYATLFEASGIGYGDCSSGWSSSRSSATSAAAGSFTEPDSLLPARFAAASAWPAPALPGSLRGAGRASLGRVTSLTRTDSRLPRLVIQIR